MVSEKAPSDADRAMERYAAGEDAAFGALYDELAPRLYGFLRRRVGDACAAEDLLQVTMLQIHRARGTFIPGAEVLPWAYAIARRLVLDRARTARRRPVLTSSEPLPEAPAPVDRPDDALAAQQLASALEAELGALPASQREAFRLLKQEGLSLAEAAQVLGTTVTAVKLRAHRAYEALRLRFPQA